MAIEQTNPNLKDAKILTAESYITDVIPEGGVQLWFLQHIHHCQVKEKDTVHGDTLNID